MCSAAVETMAYAGDVPWHGLGVPVSDDLTPDQILIAAGLDWEVEKLPLAAIRSEGVLPVPSMHALVRKSDDLVLGVCGPEYTPFQNREVFTFFDKFVKGGKMKMETAGSLLEGKQVWALANINKGAFTLPGKDAIEGYLLLSHPHIWGKAAIFKFTPIRVVCNNTLTYALSHQGHAFHVPHIQAFDEEIMVNVEEALGISTEIMSEFKEKAEFLAKTKATDQDVDRYIATLYQPELIREAANDDVIFENFKRNAYLVRDAVQTSPGNDLKSAKGTWWGAFNGVTYCIDHEFGRERDAALNNAWFGQNAKKKQLALDTAIEFAKAA